MKKLTSRNFYQFISKNEIQSDILLYPIMSNDVEKIAGGDLDIKYLYRIFVGLTCNTEIQELLTKATNLSVKYALDDSDKTWEAVDKHYKKFKNVSN